MVVDDDCSRSMSSVGAARSSEGSPVLAKHICPYCQTLERQLIFKSLKIIFGGGSINSVICLIINLRSDIECNFSAHVAVCFTYCQSANLTKSTLLSTSSKDLLPSSCSSRSAIVCNPPPDSVIASSVAEEASLELRAW